MVADPLEQPESRAAQVLALIEDRRTGKLEGIEKLLEGTPAQSGESFDPAEPGIRRSQARALRNPRAGATAIGFDVGTARSPRRTAFW